MSVCELLKSCCLSSSLREHSSFAVVMATVSVPFFRYHAHQKLVGFMAPMEVGTMSDTARSVEKHVRDVDECAREHVRIVC